MLSSMRGVVVSMGLLLAVGCGGGGAAPSEVVTEEVINVDSLLEKMAERYDDLCARRKMAYMEQDLELRRELLERNDAECKALRDSLDWVLSYREETKTK